MDIRIRSGDDWIEIDVEGKPWREGHSLPEGDWIELLKRAGATVIEEKGDFCDRCGGWFTTETCEPCAAWDKEEAEEELYGG